MTDSSRFYADGRSKVPPVTAEEIRAVLDHEDRALTAPAIGDHVWLGRGGEGSPRDGRSVRLTGVPIVRPAHIRPSLEAMINSGEVVIAIGDKAFRIGVPSNIRHHRATTTYYALAVRAEVARSRYDARVAVERTAADLAVQLSSLLGVPAVPSHTEPGTVLLRLTPALAQDMLRRYAGE